MFHTLTDRHGQKEWDTLLKLLGIHGSYDIFAVTLQIFVIFLLILLRTYTSTEGNSNQGKSLLLFAEASSILINSKIFLVAGYATEYDVSAQGGGSFAFVTVKGGRHEVPESAPAQAFQMLTNLIEEKSF